MIKKSRHGILDILRKHYTDVRITIVNDMADLEALAARKPDLVFLGMKFVPADLSLGLNDPGKVWVTDFLDEHNITYTGSNRLSNELERNKHLAKARVQSLGLNTSPFCVVPSNTIPVEDNISLTYPLFIKPTNRGGGRGIDSKSVVRNFEQLTTKVSLLSEELNSDSLIEQYLSGREFSVAILKQVDSDEYLALPIEKIAPPDEHGERLLSGEVKSSDVAIDKLVTDATIKKAITELALAVFHALGAQDFGRIDLRLNEAGEPQFLEANLIPSLIAGYGSFPKSCFMNAQLSHETIILQIVQLAFARQINLIDSTDEKEELKLASQPVA